MKIALSFLTLSSLLFISCSSENAFQTKNETLTPSQTNIHRSLTVSQNSNKDIPSQTQNKDKISLLSDEKACTIKVVQGEKVLIEDFISLVKSAVPDARIGKIQDDICIDLFAFRQILDTNHILMQLPGGGIEHANFGNIYVLTLADKKLLPLTYYNDKYSDIYASMSISPDGKRALFVKKDSPKELRFFRFDQNKDEIVKTLNGDETWDGTEFWSDVSLNINWLNEKEAQISVYKVDENNPELRIEVRKENISIQ